MHAMKDADGVLDGTMPYPAADIEACSGVSSNSGFSSSLRRACVHVPFDVLAQLARTACRTGELKGGE
jgi:hypothetical protein